MTKKKPIIGLYQTNEDAAKAIELLIEKGYTEEEIYVLAEDPEYFSDALEDAKALVASGVDEADVEGYMKHLKIGDVLLVVDPDTEHYSETLDLVCQVSEQAPQRCRCHLNKPKVERVVDFLGQKLLNKEKPALQDTHVNERGETVCDVCGGIVSPADVKADAERIIRDYTGQPLFRKNKDNTQK